MAKGLHGIQTLLLVGAAAAALMSAAVASAFDSQTFSAAAPVFTDLRVCSSTHFSRSEQRCSIDESATVLTTNRITCSATMNLVRPATLRQWIGYDGQIDPFPPQLWSAGRHRLWVNYNIRIPQPLPGGSWQCGFSAAKASARLVFTSGGPTGPVVDVAACGAAQAYDKPIDPGPCKADQTSTPIPSTAPIHCSGVYAGAKGKNASIVMFYDGTPATENAFKELYSVQIHSVTYGEPVAGSYECQFRLAGAVVADKKFQVS